ncbi:MAG: HPr family phosphocarrier protein [Spirochaetaceae bacterium]|jgi:phosphotransferase system HPr (HPr) family protein|nr:HPr family phosphocarrier protein [Spirochaetaceae bacterium]
MREAVYTIVDPDGIHARPAGRFVEKMQTFSSAVTVSRGDKSSDAKKLFALMKLRVKAGETITISAEGEDEDAAVEAAVAFLKENL